MFKTNQLGGLHRRLDGAEDRLDKSEDGLIENIQNSEAQREKQVKRTGKVRVK